MNHSLNSRNSPLSVPRWHQFFRISNDFDEAFTVDSTRTDRTYVSLSNFLQRRKPKLLSIFLAVNFVGQLLLLLS